MIRRTASRTAILWRALARRAAVAKKKNTKRCQDSETKQKGGNREIWLGVEGVFFPEGKVAEVLLAI